MSEKRQFLKILQSYDQNGNNIKSLMKNAYTEINHNHNQAKLILKNVYREFEHWHNSIKLTIQQLVSEIKGGA